MSEQAKMDADATIYHRAQQARRACLAARVEPKEIRFSPEAHMIAVGEKAGAHAWGSTPADPWDTYLGLKCLVEKDAVPPLEEFAERRGDEELPIGQPTVCVAGIGRLGRWFYFDA